MSEKSTSLNISVIIQGPIITGSSDSVKWTKQSCSSVRQYLPEAEIVLSTWKGSNTADLDYDILVENEDPGSCEAFYGGDSGEKSCNNFNRQLVSTVNGIKAATGKYVMKLRTDSIITGNDFLKYFNQYGQKKIHDGGTKERILTLEPRNPFGFFEGAFCLCDFWFYGLKEDMLKLWDIPFYIRSKTWERDLLGEEYLFYNYIKSLDGISFNHLMNGGKSPDIKKAYKKIMASEFVIVPTRKSGIKSLKYPQLNSFSIVCLRHYVWSFSDWKVNYDDFYGYKECRYKILSKIESYLGGAVLFLKKVKGIQ